jgi:formamidopyrimidine-DNA glycosylase
MRGEPELSAWWGMGLGVALVLGAAYLAEEIVWMFRRQGRPCRHCGQKVRMKSFSVLTTCPHCGKPFE